MSSNWDSISFADLISERKERFEPDAPEIFGLTKIDKIDFAEGKLHLAKYEPTKTQQIIVEPGDFVFSGLNIEKGAVGFNETGSRLVVSANYSTCSYDQSRVSSDFFKHYIRSKNFQKLLKANLKKDYGFTRPKHLMPLTFFVPRDKSEQERIVRGYESRKANHEALSSEITHQQSLLTKLKQAILQEAIQGKLTADWRAANPDTETASELLKEIAEARDNWIKDAKALGDDEAKTIERKLIKLKAAPAAKPIKCLPTSWEWATLIEANLLIVDCHNKTAPYQSSGIPIIRTTNVRNGKIDLARTKHISEQTYQRWSARCIPLPGDLIFTREAPVGEVGQIPEGARVCLGQRTMLIRPMPQYVMPSYLLLAIQAPEFMQRASRVKRGAMVGHLRVGDVETAHIPLPPIAEQAAIVERVEALMETCRELEKEIESSRTHADQLLQAVLKEAFSPAS
jgi:type I restriction enzyme S subunit